MSTYLIGYDIRNARRLQRVHRKLLAAAMPLEYSVFLFVGSDEGCRRSVEDCLSLMNPNEDELRCYRLPAHGRRFEIGRTVLPDGVVWTGWSASESVD